MATIHYFAYGADMLHQKMKLHGFPSELKCNATLRGWKLVFTGEDPRWKGAAPSIKEEEASVVQGVVYKISEQHLAMFDAEEPGYKAIKMVIEAGATENKLPIDYFRKLEKIDENGFRGKVDFDVDLIRSFNQ